MRGRNTLLLTSSKLAASAVQMIQLVWAVSVMRDTEAGFLLVVMTLAFVLSSILDFGLTTQLVVSANQRDLRTISMIRRTTNQIFVLAAVSSLIATIAQTAFSYEQKMVIFSALCWALVERLSETHFMFVSATHSVVSTAVWTTVRRVLALGIFAILTNVHLFSAALTFTVSNFAGAMIIWILATRGDFPLKPLTREEYRSIRTITAPHFWNNVAFQIKNFDLWFCSLFVSPAQIAGLALGTRLAMPVQIFFGSAGTSNLLTREHNITNGKMNTGKVLFFLLPLSMVFVFADQIADLCTTVIPWIDGTDVILCTLVLTKHVIWGSTTVLITDLVKSGLSKVSARINFYFLGILFTTLVTVLGFTRSIMLSAISSIVVALLHWLALHMTKVRHL